VLGTVALPDFALGEQPMFIFVAFDTSVLLPEFVGAATDLIFQVDGHDVLASLGLRLAKVGNRLGRNGRIYRGDRRGDGFPVGFVAVGARTFCFGHNGILLTSS